MSSYSRMVFVVHSLAVSSHSKLRLDLLAGKCSLVAFDIWCIIVNNEGERQLFTVANKQA